MFHNLYATISFFLIPFSTGYKKAEYFQFDILDLIKEILNLRFLISHLYFYTLLRIENSLKRQ